MPPYAYVILFAGWLLWLLPFFIAEGRGRKPARTLDRRARWGMVIQAVSYALLWQNNFWSRTPQPWQVALSVLFLLLAISLSWTATRALGQQWRMDAGLNADHELVRAGAYRILRHPIYASMLCVFLGTGFMIAPWPWFLAAAVVFFIGTEIRVRIEDGLLVSRFGEQFREYANSTSAYVPFVR
jgi:protein-S-isoprenylcysteine O-methyltransferase Ste14